MDDVDEATPGESACQATLLDKAWTIIEYLAYEARDYITNKSEAERHTDEKVFALLAHRFGTESSKIHIQQQFRTRNQNSEEDYKQYLDALEGLRSQGYPNEEVTIRRYEIMQRFIEGVRNFELKRNLALMYAPEQYVEVPPTVDALRFTVQHYLRMRGSSRSDNYPMVPPQQQQPQHPNRQPNKSPAAPRLRKTCNNRHLSSQRLIDSNLKEHVSIAATHHTL